MGNGAWGIGHWLSGIGYRELGINYRFAVIDFLTMPHAPCPLPELFKRLDPAALDGQVESQGSNREHQHALRSLNGKGPQIWLSPQSRLASGQSPHQSESDRRTGFELGVGVGADDVAVGNAEEEPAQTGDRATCEPSERGGSEFWGVKRPLHSGDDAKRQKEGHSRKRACLQGF